MWEDSLATGNHRTVSSTRKRRNAGAVMYVTETIITSFPPLTITYSSQKTSHPRMLLHPRDLINENPATSKTFPYFRLFPPYPPPTKPLIYLSIQIHAILRRHAQELLVHLFRILNSHFPLPSSRRLVFIVDLYHLLFLRLDSYFAPPSR